MTSPSAGAIMKDKDTKLFDQSDAPVRLLRLEALALLWRKGTEYSAEWASAD